MNRTERLYKIQSLLSTRASVSISEFLRILEVSRATFRRDLEYLRDRLGAPVFWDRDKDGYRLESPQAAGQTSLPGLWFNERETLALLTMVQMLSTLEPNGLISDQIEPIKKRLYGILESGCANADELSNRIRVLPIALRPVDQEVFKCIADGLLNRKRLAVMHTSKKSNQKTERVVSPQQLVYYRDNWYLDAFCHEKDDLRTFSVDSIHAATPLESPAVSLTKNALAEAFEETYGIFAGKRAQVAKLRFSPFRARWVSREVWHPAQKAYFEDDGHYILEVPYGDQRELILDILRQGSECEVLAPDSLRTEVINQLIAASKTYHLK